MRALAAWLMVVLAPACGRVGFEARTTGGPDGGSGDGGDSGAVPAMNTGMTSMAARYGGTGTDEGYDIAVAADGTVVVTGAFQGTLAVGAMNATSAGSDDVPIIVLEPSGAPRWVRSIGGAGSDRGQAIAVDSMGQIYVCGLFSGTASFGGTNRTAAGMWDVFLVSYDAAGTVRWVKTAGGVGADFAYDLVIDAQDNVLMTGYYEGAVDFGAGPLPAAGARDVFVAKYAADSTLQWARGYGSAATDSGQGVAVTPAGDVVVTGTLGGATNFGGGAIGAAGAGFIVSLDGGGAYRWAKPMPNTAPWDIGVDVQTSRALIATRNFANADVGDGPIALAHGGSSDGMIVAFNADGSLAWHDEFGGTLDDLGLGLALDTGGNAYTIGLGGADLTSSAGTTMGKGTQDIFLIAHDPTGTPKWGRMFGGVTQDRGYGAAIAPDGALWVTGRFAGTADFGTGPMTSAGGDDMFVTKLY